jgi:hypothetical protein
MTLTKKQRACRKGGRARSAAKRTASRTNGAKGGRPRTAPLTTPAAIGSGSGVAPAPTAGGVRRAASVRGLPPLWQRIEAFLRASGPRSLQSLRCLGADQAERERVVQELKRRPEVFVVVGPSPTVGEDVWHLAPRA